MRATTHCKDECRPPVTCTALDVLPGEEVTEMYQTNHGVRNRPNDPNSLPPFWVEVKNADGSVYYGNQKTGKAQWERPTS